MPKTSKEHDIGYNKGALDVLAKEREELIRIVSIVEQIMAMHTQKLQDLGVEMGGQWAKPKGTDKPIDDLI